jgi:segregation and condensation protein B
VELSEIIPHLEALIFASEKPLTAAEMVELVNNALGFMEERIMPEQVEQALEAIKEKYQSEFYAFEVVESGGGWQFLTKKAYHKTVVQLNGDKFLKRLSNAALETLAIIAYKQPITKGEIETIRGVNSDYSVQKLLEKELILISGRNEELPGKPLLYTTSKNFMDYFGINSPNDLPKIKEVLADEAMNATIIKPEDFASNTVSAEDSENSTIVVNEQGELLINDEGNSNNENSENNEEDSAKNSEE